MQEHSGWRGGREQTETFKPELPEHENWQPDDVSQRHRQRRRQFPRGNTDAEFGQGVCQVPRNTWGRLHTHMSFAQDAVGGTIAQNHEKCRIRLAAERENHQKKSNFD